ncbi:MAG: S-methyl-5-thioribose-1-phosphate isomerase [Methanosarcinales archaeon Met12]|nr:MAG: S-methyl-5-thioribose-1-phosphate isomerase [Methanosarcinales archaeon Met12]
MRTINWSDNGHIILTDQTKLPKECATIECNDVDTLAEAIRSLRVRGAPALGVAGGFGIALAAQTSRARSQRDLIRDIEHAAEVLRNTRPTAVNLFWGIERVLKKTKTGRSVHQMKELALEEARKMADEDVEICKRIGEHGAKLLEDGDVIMTYCNAGRMACVDWGTAIGVIRSAIGQGKRIKVIACETRPLNQGSRITAWELLQDDVQVILITDNMVGHVVKSGMADKIIVGADRIVEDAVFNKIGTYTLSIIAKEHKIPFYVAAPMSTFDFEKRAADIEIEERSPQELKYFGDEQIAPLEVEVYNPAFDATPMENITAIITENGVFHPPFSFKDIRGKES